MPVNTCTTNAKSSKLPNAAAQRAPPGNGSRSIVSFSRRQPVRWSQKPDDFSRSLLTFSPGESLDVDGNAVPDADFEILPLDPELAPARLVRQLIHRSGRRAGDELPVRVKNPAMAGTSKFRLLRMPVDR